MSHPSNQWTNQMSNFNNTTTQWSRDEDKLFERLILEFHEGIDHRWERIAYRMPGKSVYDVTYHYRVLLNDIADIEADRTELPRYSDDLPEMERFGSWNTVDNPSWMGPIRRDAADTKKKSSPWTVDEHKLFLKGLEIYEKGDWRSISRNVVKTRTASQVASHAQKYFQRKEQMENGRKTKRQSIHDIRTLDESQGLNGSAVPPPPAQPDGPAQELHPDAHVFNPWRL